MDSSTVSSDCGSILYFIKTSRFILYTTGAYFTKAPVTQNPTSKSRTRSYGNLVDVVVSGNEHGLYTEKSICQWKAAKHTLFPVIPRRNTRPMTVLCPWQTPKLSRLTASPQVLITKRTPIITCVSRVLHVFTTCAASVCPLAKILGSSKHFRASDAVPIFPASCHVYKSTVARLKLEINANNIVCLTGDHFLTGFGRD